MRILICRNNLQNVNQNTYSLIHIKEERKKKKKEERGKEENVCRHGSVWRQMSTGQTHMN